MREEGKRPQYMEEKKYRKLFGLDIYLTPVFIISSIVIVVLYHRSTRFPRRCDKTLWRCQKLAYREL